MKLIFSTTSLKWEYESPALIWSQAIKVLLVERQFKTFVFVHLSSPLTGFLSYIFTAHCSDTPSLFLPHAQHSFSSSDLKYQFAFLSIRCEHTAHLCTDTPISHTQRNLVLLSLLPPSSALIEGVINIYVAVKEAEAELKRPCISHDSPPPPPFFLLIHPLFSSKPKGKVSV